MKQINIPSDLSSFYEKTKNCFNECIQNEDNNFLKDELSIPIDKIIVAEKHIRIVFMKRNYGEFLIEVCLALSDGRKEIGQYTYTLNEKKEGVDDSLVFY